MREQENQELENQQEEKKDKKSKLLLLLILLLLIIIGFGGFYIFQQNANNKSEVAAESEKPKYDVGEDSGVSDTAPEAPEKNEEEKLGNNMMNITISSNPCYSEGVLYLKMQNKDINTYPQVVELMLKAENEGEEDVMLFKSGAIPVGKYLNETETKLEVDLEPGNYKCVAMFRGINETTGELMGSAGANVTLTVY